MLVGVKILLSFFRTDSALARQIWTNFNSLLFLGLHSFGMSYAGEFGLKTCRRMRTVFSAEQLQKLEEVFAKQRYMTGSEKVLLASALRLTETQVKVWFQNRRTKWRKSREIEERPKDQCSDLKHETFVTEDREFKSVHSDESAETWTRQAQSPAFTQILVKQDTKASCHYVALKLFLFFFDCVKKKKSANVAFW